MVHVCSFGKKIFFRRELVCSTGITMVLLLALLRPFSKTTWFEGSELLVLLLDLLTFFYFINSVYNFGLCH